MPALAEDCLDLLEGGLGGRVKERPVRADSAVWGPRVDVVGVLCEVRAGVVVPVGGGDDRGVLVAMAENVCADPSRDLGASGHGEGPALTEVVLHVDQDQRSSEIGGHGSNASRGGSAALAFEVGRDGRVAPRELERVGWQLGTRALVTPSCGVQRKIS